MNTRGHGDGFPDAAQPAQGEAPDPNQNERSSHLTDQVAELSLCVPDLRVYSLPLTAHEDSSCVLAPQQRSNRPHVLPSS